MKIICWWSGGITSAVACKLAIERYGVENCEAIMIDTRNEDEDTYRFKKDCEAYYGLEIQTIDSFGDKYDCIQDVWRKHLSLNTANGAICSSELKRNAREKWEKENTYDHQIFGFEFDSKEFKRALGLKLNHPQTKPLFPLLMEGMDKEDCIRFIQDAGIVVPRMYKLGFKNNNCFQTGCIQGGIGYFQKLNRDFPEKYNAMAALEHELTDKKGSPVTCLKDQSKESMALAKSLGLTRKYMPLFLTKHKDYPEYGTVLEKMDMKVQPLMECNGLCGVNDLIPNFANEEF
jgi:hypothetical protein